MNRRSGFSWVETLVALSLVSILAAFAWVNLKSALVRCGVPQVLINMKQLHLATQSMALDGTRENPTNACWPGDTGGTFSNWAARIVPDYIGTNDFCKLLSLPDRTVPLGKIPTVNTNAILIYQVREEHDGTFVLFTSANFTNTPTGGSPPPLTGSEPYGTKGFAVFRKGGDGALLLTKQAGNTNLVGSFAPLCK
jgi:prepilin-type N-terminal cleavage/methylation domain-containing protein